MVDDKLETNLDQVHGLIDTLNQIIGEEELSDLLKKMKDQVKRPESPSPEITI